MDTNLGSGPQYPGKSIQDNSISGTNNYVHVVSAADELLSDMESNRAKTSSISSGVPTKEDIARSLAAPMLHPASASQSHSAKVAQYSQSVSVAVEEGSRIRKSVTQASKTSARPSSAAARGGSRSNSKSAGVREQLSSNGNPTENAPQDPYAVQQIKNMQDEIDYLRETVDILVDSHAGKQVLGLSGSSTAGPLASLSNTLGSPQHNTWNHQSSINPDSKDLQAIKAAKEQSKNARARESIIRHEQISALVSDTMNLRKQHEQHAAALREESKKLLSSATVASANDHNYQRVNPAFLGVRRVAPSDPNSDDINAYLHGTSNPDYPEEDDAYARQARRMDATNNALIYEEMLRSDDAFAQESPERSHSSANQPQSSSAAERARALIEKYRPADQKQSENDAHAEVKSDSIEVINHDNDRVIMPGERFMQVHSEEGESKNDSDIKSSGLKPTFSSSIAVTAGQPVRALYRPTSSPAQADKTRVVVTETPGTVKIASAAQYRPVQDAETHRAVMGGSATAPGISKAGKHLFHQAAVSEDGVAVNVPAFKRGEVDYAPAPARPFSAGAGGAVGGGASSRRRSVHAVDAINNGARNNIQGSREMLLNTHGSVSALNSSRNQQQQVVQQRRASFGSSGTTGVPQRRASVSFQDVQPSISTTTTSSTTGRKNVVGSQNNGIAPTTPLRNPFRARPSSAGPRSTATSKFEFGSFQRSNSRQQEPDLSSFSKTQTSLRSIDRNVNNHRTDTSIDPDRSRFEYLTSRMSHTPTRPMSAGPMSRAELHATYSSMPGLRKTHRDTTKGTEFSFMTRDESGRGMSIREFKVLQDLEEKLMEEAEALSYQFHAQPIAGSTRDLGLFARVMEKQEARRREFLDARRREVERSIKPFEIVTAHCDEHLARQAAYRAQVQLEREREERANRQFHAVPVPSTTSRPDSEFFALIRREMERPARVQANARAIAARAALPPRMELAVEEDRQRASRREARQKELEREDKLKAKFVPTPLPDFHSMHESFAAEMARARALANNRPGTAPAPFRFDTPERKEAERARKLKYEREALLSTSSSLKIREGSQAFKEGEDLTGVALATHRSASAGGRTSGKNSVKSITEKLAASKAPPSAMTRAVQLRMLETQRRIREEQALLREQKEADETYAESVRSATKKYAPIIRIMESRRLSEPLAWQCETLTAQTSRYRRENEENDRRHEQETRRKLIASQTERPLVMLRSTIEVQNRGGRVAVPGLGFTVRDILGASDSQENVDGTQPSFNASSGFQHIDDDIQRDIDAAERILAQQA